MAISIFLLTLILLTITYSFNLQFQNQHDHHYSKNEQIYAKVSSLTSVDTLLAFDYYELPFCEPSTVIDHNPGNIGQLLMGQKSKTSPYRLHVNVNESFYLCTTSKLNKKEVELLYKRTNKFLHADMIIGDLPALRSPGQEDIQTQHTGFPIAYHGFPLYVYYIMNHLKFMVSLHETKREGSLSYEIVGFEVSPCSIKRDTTVMSKLNRYDSIERPTSCLLPRMERQEIKVNEIITFTYEVEFRLSNITWQGRSEAYSENGKEGNYIDVTIDSIVMVLIAVGFTISAISKIESKGAVNQPLMNNDIVFKCPGCSKILCVMVGNGIQIAGMFVATLVFALLGLFNSPSYGGLLLKNMIILYIILGIFAGYVAVSIWIRYGGVILTNSSSGWISVSFLTSCFLPGSIFIMISAINITHYINGSIAMISGSMYAQLIAIWFCVLVPFTFLGSYIASKQEHNSPCKS